MVPLLRRLLRRRRLLVLSRRHDRERRRHQVGVSGGEAAHRVHRVVRTRPTCRQSRHGRGHCRRHGLWLRRGRRLRRGQRGRRRRRRRRRWLCSVRLGGHGLLTLGRKVALLRAAGGRPGACLPYGRQTLHGGRRVGSLGGAPLAAAPTARGLFPCGPTTGGRCTRWGRRTGCGRCASFNDARLGCRRRRCQDSVRGLRRRRRGACTGSRQRRSQLGCRPHI